MVDTAPTFLALVGSLFDDVSRGVAITSLPALVAASSNFSGTAGAAGNLWTTLLLSGILTCGGGWIVQLFNLNHPQWSLGIPTIISGKGSILLDSLEFWAAMIASVVYCSITRLHPSLEPISELIMSILPPELTLNSDKSIGVDPEIASALTILVLGTLYCSKVIIKLISASNTRRRTSAARSARERKETDSLDWMEDGVSTQQKGSNANSGARVVKATGREGTGQVKSRKKKSKEGRT